MFRTDHCYPPTVRAPLDDSPVFDFHFEAIAMPPAPLPPVVEPLAPSPRRTNNPPVPPDGEVLWQKELERVRAGIRRKAVYIPKGADREVRRQHLEPKPPNRVPWLACAIGAALFAVGYLLGRWLP